MSAPEGAALGVVIIAGGAGLRLASALDGRPKALAPLGDGTLLDHQLRRLAPLGAAETCVLACARHQAAAIGAALQGRATLLTEAEPLGTAGGLHLLPPGPRRWLTINVDHVSDVNLAEFLAQAEGPCTALVHQKRVTIDEGVVIVRDGPLGPQLMGWQERPSVAVEVTAGLYVFEAEALRLACRGQRIDMPALVSGLMPAGVRAHRHSGVFIDAGTPERLAAAAAFIRGPLTNG